MYGDKDIVMSPSVAILFEGDKTITQDMSRCCVGFITQHTLAFSFNPPGTKIGGARKRIGDTIESESDHGLREVVNHVGPSDIRGHEVVPSRKITILAKAIEADTHLVCFSLFHYMRYTLTFDFGGGG